MLAVEDPHNPDNDVGAIAFKIDSAKLAFEEAFNKLKEVYPDFALRRVGGLSGSPGLYSSHKVKNPPKCSSEQSVPKGNQNYKKIGSSWFLHEEHSPDTISGFRLSRSY